MTTWIFLCACLLLCNVSGWISRIHSVRRSHRFQSVRSLDFFGKRIAPKYATTLFHPRLIANEPDLSEEEYLHWQRALPPYPVVGRNTTARVEVVKDSGLRLSIPNEPKWLFMPVNEVCHPFDPLATANFTVGQLVTAPVIGRFMGMFVMSIRRTTLDRLYREMNFLHQTGSTFNATVKRVNRGGCEMRYKGLKGFLPISHVSGGPHNVSTLNSTMLGRAVEVQIFKIDPYKGTVYYTQRQAKFSAADSKQFDLVNVTCSGSRDFGVFFTLPSGRTGLVHVSQLSQKMVYNASGLFEVGERAMAVVMDDGTVSGRVGLSMRGLEPMGGDILVNKSKVFDDVERRWSEGGLREKVIRELEEAEARRMIRAAAATQRSNEVLSLAGPSFTSSSSTSSTSSPVVPVRRPPPSSWQKRNTTTDEAGAAAADGDASGDFMIDNGAITVKVPGIKYNPPLKRGGGERGGALVNHVTYRSRSNSNSTVTSAYSKAAKFDRYSQSKGEYSRGRVGEGGTSQDKGGAERGAAAAEAIEEAAVSDLTLPLQQAVTGNSVVTASPDINNDSTTSLPLTAVAVAGSGSGSAGSSVVSSLLRSPHVDRALLASVMGEEEALGGESVESILGDLLGDYPNSNAHLNNNNNRVKQPGQQRQQVTSHHNPAAFTAQSLGEYTSMEDKESDSENDNEATSDNSDNSEEDEGEEGEESGEKSSTTGREKGVEKMWKQFQTETEVKLNKNSDDRQTLLLEREEQDGDEEGEGEDLLSDLDLLEEDLRLFEEQEHREYWGEVEDEDDVNEDNVKEIIIEEDSSDDDDDEVRDIRAGDEEEDERKN